MNSSRTRDTEGRRPFVHGGGLVVFRNDHQYRDGRTRVRTSGRPSSVAAWTSSMHRECSTHETLFMSKSTSPVRIRCVRRVLLVERHHPYGWGQCVRTLASVIPACPEASKRTMTVSMFAPCVVSSSSVALDTEDDASTEWAR